MPRTPNNDQRRPSGPHTPPRSHILVRKSAKPTYVRHNLTTTTNPREAWVFDHDRALRLSRLLPGFEAELAALALYELAMQHNSGGTLGDQF